MNEALFCLGEVGTSDKGMKQIYFLRLADLTMLCPFSIGTNSDELVALLTWKLSTRSSALLTGKNTPAPHSPSKASLVVPTVGRKASDFAYNVSVGKGLYLPILWNKIKHKVLCLITRVGINFQWAPLCFLGCYRLLLFAALACDWLTVENKHHSGTEWRLIVCCESRWLTVWKLVLRVC